MPRKSANANSKPKRHATTPKPPIKRGRTAAKGLAKQAKGRATAHANGKSHANGNGHATNGSRVAPALRGGGKRTLPVIAAAREQVPCLSCGLCCGYVAVEIESPNTVSGATEILWYLYHQNISIYTDDGEWMVQFETRCQHLMDDHRCAIYEQRPQICRDFDETGCEVNAEEIGQSFYNAGEFLSWLAQHHKRVHSIIKQRYMPPESTLTGQPVSRTPLQSFRTRFQELRPR
jgi:Fe-S-cluster containining protein